MKSPVALRIAALLGAVALAAFGAMSLIDSRPEEPLPVLATIPDFTLVEASGKPLSRSDLTGAPWVANLIFTSCAGVCPALTREMKRLESQTTDLADLRFVSISVDPETDTPPRLLEYAQRFGADRARWFFLTGDDGVIRNVAKVGLLLPVADGNPERGDEAVLHSPRFVLIDADGRVRGSYDGQDPEAMLRLRGDVRRIADEHAPS